jgi:hypothetical protein
MKLFERDGYTVLDLGQVEIWDGADLALLRDTLTQVIAVRGGRKVGINMRWVKYIPSGFFGMLYDWHEKGVSIRLYTPQPHVARMLWFRQFFDDLSDDCFLLRGEPKEMIVPQDEIAWEPEDEWEESEEVAGWRR